MQISSIEEPTPLTSLCQVCYSTLTDPITLTDCGHILDVVCFVDYINHALENGQVPIKCPFSACRDHVNAADVNLHAEELMPVFHKQTLIAYRYLHNMQQCYNPNCDFFFELTEKARYFCCPKCYKINCISCKSEDHPMYTCEEYSSITAYDDTFYLAAEEFSYKQCPKCKFWVERTEGCKHITCRCTFSFCYDCGGVHGKCICNGFSNSLMFEEIYPELSNEKQECRYAFMWFSYHRPVRTLADFFYEDED